MTNTLEEGYATPASLATLKRLKDLGANSVSVLPYGFVRDAAGEAVLFVHRTAARRDGRGDSPRRSSTRGRSA